MTIPLLITRHAQQRRCLLHALFIAATGIKNVIAGENVHDTLFIPHQPWLHLSDHAVAIPKPILKTQRHEKVPLIEWTNRSLELIVKYRQNPLRAARCLTYCHVVMHDALWLARKQSPSIRHAVAHLAAANMLAYLYPQETPGSLQRLGVAAASKSVPVDSHGWPLVQSLALQVIDAAIMRAWQDGSERDWAINTQPTLTPEQWQPAPPLRIKTPTEALAGAWITWLISSGAALEAPAPPAYNSEQTLREMTEVWRVNQTLSLEQKAIAEQWNLDKGTVTPAGVWNKIALSHARQKKINDEQTVVLLANLNVAMMDACIACWHTKFRYWTQRPITAIRAHIDSRFTPHLLTPAFPGYVSGHASISGAAAGILKLMCPDEGAEFERLAQEAAYSRLLGGIHIRSDNEAGLMLGYAVAAKMPSRLRPTAS